MAAKSARPFTPPPARGRPYFDAGSGRMMVVPAGGGKAVPYVGPRPGFDPGRALRRAGIEAGELGREGLEQAGRLAGGIAARAPFDFGGFGSLLVGAGAALLSLILLDLVLSERGSGAVGRLLELSGRGLRAFVDPADPLIGAGARSTPASSTSTTSVIAYPSPIPAGLRPAPGVPAGGLAPSGRLVPVGKERIDAAYLGLVEWIEREFAVTLTSGHRTPAENTATGGAPRSDHLTASAGDFSGSPAAMARLAAWAARQPFAYVEYDPLGIGDTSDPSDHTDHVHISFWRQGR